MDTLEHTVDTPTSEVVTGDEFDAMSDRELLLSMARDSRAVKQLIAGAVDQVAPLLSNPKVKLMLKLL